MHQLKSGYGIQVYVHDACSVDAASCQKVNKNTMLPKFKPIPLAVELHFLDDISQSAENSTE